jgi:hypothetical protein
MIKLDRPVLRTYYAQKKREFQKYGTRFLEKGVNP